MVRWFSALVFALALALPSLSRADAVPDSGPLGFGIILGDPTGLTLKARLSQKNAIQFHLGLGVGDRYSKHYKNGRVSLILDYLFHFTGVPLGSAGVLAPYAGIGGKLIVWDHSDDAAFGVRVPLGLAFFIRGAPIEIAAEIAIGIHVLPETSTLVDGGLMGRWYF